MEQDLISPSIQLFPPSSRLLAWSSSISIGSIETRGMKKTELKHSRNTCSQMLHMSLTLFQIPFRPPYIDIALTLI